MILNETEIKQILTTPQNGDIKRFKEAHAILDIYVNGGNVASELEKIKNFENEGQKTLRKKIAKSTKDKVSDLLKPLHKVFNANGGSTDYSELTDTEQTKFTELVDKLPEGISVRKWMETYWKDAFVADPNAVILIEATEKGTPYPTYKSIDVIHDYEMEWETFKYLVLIHGKNEDDETIFRVIDDEKDALYIFRDEKELIKYENQIEHNHGFVPAIICGGLPDKTSSGKLPFIEKIDESLKEYLRSASVFSIYKFLHLFPKFWSYAMKCIQCNGSGLVPNSAYEQGGTEPNQKKCPSCEGKRLKIATDVSDGIYLPIPKEGQQVIGKNIAGYIDLPTEAWKQMKEDLDDQLMEMQFTLWGAYLIDREQTNREKTATETVINAQPINEVLHQVSRFAESKETKILDFMARMEFGKEERIRTYYGKQFTTENADAIWKRYLKAKEEGAPISTLDYFYEQYLLSEFQNDLSMFEKRKKILSIEPFPHYSLEDIKGTATQDQVQQKMVFSQWVVQEIDFNQDEKKLKTLFTEYLTKNKQDEKVTEE